MEYCEKQYNSQLGLTFQYSNIPFFRPFSYRARWSKTARCKAPEISGSEAYLPVRRRWPLFTSLLIVEIPFRPLLPMKLGSPLFDLLFRPIA